MSLRVWLADLKARQVTMTVQNGQPTLSQGASDHDQLMLERHRWALSRARLWPVWFAWVANPSNPYPTLAEVPWVHDPTCQDGKAFGCARCGWPAVRIDEFGLAWCQDHRADMAVEPSLFEEAA